MKTVYPEHAGSIDIMHKRLNKNMLSAQNQSATYTNNNNLVDFNTNSYELIDDQIVNGTSHTPVKYSRLQNAYPGVK